MASVGLDIVLKALDRHQRFLFVLFSRCRPALRTGPPVAVVVVNGLRWWFGRDWQKNEVVIESRGWSEWSNGYLVLDGNGNGLQSN